MTTTTATNGGGGFHLRPHLSIVCVTIGYVQLIIIIIVIRTSDAVYIITQ